MKARESPLFFSYARADKEFALMLAKSLRSAGANLWIDQLDIQAGDHWDRAVEQALMNAESVLVILSPAAVDSKNVNDEISFAIDENKRIVPLLYQTCKVPMRLRRLQHVDFRVDFNQGLKRLLSDIGLKRTGEEIQTVQPVEQGHAGTLFDKPGWMLERFLPGVTQSDNPVVDLHKAAESGNKEVQGLLGWMYASGWGIVAQSDAEAVKWFRMAAEQGDAYSQHGLGDMYANGRGVAKSDTEAVKWYRKAAEQDYEQAQEKLRKRGLSW